MRLGIDRSPGKQWPFLAKFGTLGCTSWLVCHGRDCFSGTWVFVQLLVLQKVILSGWGDGEEKSGGNGWNGVDLFAMEAPPPYLEGLQDHPSHLQALLTLCRSLPRRRKAYAKGQSCRRCRINKFVCTVGNVYVWGTQIMGFDFIRSIVYLYVLVLIAVTACYALLYMKRNISWAFKVSSALSLAILLLCLKVNES